MRRRSIKTAIRFPYTVGFLVFGRPSKSRFAGVFPSPYFMKKTLTCHKSEKSGSLKLRLFAHFI